MGQTSIPCTTEARDELSKTKPDGMSWSDYLIGLRDESDQLKEIAMNGSRDDTVYGEPDLSEIRASLETIEQRTGSIERTLEDLQR